MNMSSAVIREIDRDLRKQACAAAPFPNISKIPPYRLCPRSTALMA
jgi:hypothetical protein